jgi:hypothetical protein
LELNSVGAEFFNPSANVLQNMLRFGFNENIEEYQEKKIIKSFDKNTHLSFIDQIKLSQEDFKEFC